MRMTASSRYGACGAVADMAIAAAVDSGAAFVVSPLLPLEGRGEDHEQGRQDADDRAAVTRIPGRAYWVLI